MEENVELKEFRETITENEAQAIKDRRNYQKYFIDDERYKSIMVMADSTYDGFLEMQTLAKTNFSITLLHKENIDRNKIDLIKCQTDRKDKNGEFLTMKAIELETLTAEINLSNSLAKLRKSISKLFPYIGLDKLDGTPIVLEADLWRFIEDMEKKLSKVGLSIYKEKVL